MLGVVLWSDNTDNKAVIWCEDHGDLAFFNGGETLPLEAIEFDAGDLVLFDLHQEKHLRYAHNPRRIEQGAYDGLSEDLQAAAAPRQPNQMLVPKKVPVGSADVIPFSQAKHVRADRELVAV